MENKNKLDRRSSAIGRKTFSLEDQLLFAQLSGDYNPMHVDSIAARRLIAGAPVVHGIHLLLVALEFYFERELTQICGLKCDFRNPVVIGESADFFHIVGNETNRIEIKVEGVLCTQILLFQNKRRATKELHLSFETDLGYSLQPLELANLQPIDQDIQLHLGRKYVLASITCPNAFLKVRGALGSSAVSGMLGLSYFVGMVCPGLNSIFASLSVDFAQATVVQEGLVFLVSRVDERYNLCEIEVHGDLLGELATFMRPSPALQPTLSELSADVAHDEFRLTSSLILGGSRGLGEVTAKLLTSGGGSVVITYAMGAADAERTRGEIEESGIGRCSVRQFNLLTDNIAILEPELASVGSIYYFPTPKISRRKGELFEGSLFSEFIKFYVEAFYRLCKYLEDTRESGVKIYYPSTIYVGDRPRNLSEYAMAKGAAEIMIEDINRYFKKVSVCVTRLPRLHTDQTSSVLGVEAESNINTMLAVIRRMTFNA